MTATGGNDRGVEVLVAEDSPTQVEQLRHLLESRGFTVTTAADGRAALAATARRPPALVISDVMMPELDGYGLCKAIKTDPALKDIPVILVTTLSDPGDVIRGLECGADNFIRKPYEERYLLSRLEQLLMNRELRATQKMQMGVEIRLGGERHFITAERQQILDLLISTYEQAVHLNDELKARERELANSNEVLNGLYRIAEGLNRVTSEQAVAETALDRALELPGVQAGWIFLRDGAAGFRLAGARGLPAALTDAGAMDGDCACKRRLLAGELNVVTNIMECERLGRSRGETGGLRVHASVPLWLGDRTLGLMNLAGPQQGLFDEAALKVLHGVGNQVAVALERAHLHEHLEQLVGDRTAALTAEVTERRAAEARVTRLNRVYAVLSGINTTIVRTRDRQELFDEACRIAVEHGGFRMAWIGLVEADGSQVAPKSIAGTEDGYLFAIGLVNPDRSLEGYPLLAQALRDKTPVVGNDIAADERMRPWRDEALKRGYRSLTVLPLVLEARAVGVFVLYASEPGAFDEEEMRLLTEMAGDVSFALDHLRKEEQLNYLAYYDVLTGLPNRELFFDRVDQLVRSVREGERVALLVIDLERLRHVNETLGRPAGDALLRQFAGRLGATLGERATHARIGADNFGVAIGNVRDESDVADALEGGIMQVLSEPLTIDGNELRVSAKIGIALFPNDGADAESLFQNAEAAVKKAKASGDKYLFYTPELNARVAERFTLENRLRTALEREQLVLHYQPKVDLAAGTISGVEALIRWNDPESGLVPPLKFIPILEETGMIFEAGRWAIGRAVADHRAWHAGGLPAPRVAVNVSPIQLRQKDFVADVERALRGGGAGLELEITEGLLMQDIEANIRKLKAVRELGVEIAVDDFGTGYSSLSYIARLPVNTLKIDRAFITHMTGNPDDLSIVSTIISLAHSLNLKVVAEGVETEEQAKILRLLKCDEIQGYLFSPPVPAEKIGHFLREKKVLGG